jgi:hypothetical protein
MDCLEARQVFTRAADSAARDQGALRLAAAEAHVAACPVCQTRMDQLAKAVLSLADDEISCAECGSQLHRYVETDLAGGDAAAALPLVHAHLAACPECGGDFAEARLALADLSLGRLPQPEHVPEFDTGFLRRPSIFPARDPRWLGRAAAAAALLLAAGALCAVAVLRPWNSGSAGDPADRSLWTELSAWMGGSVPPQLASTIVSTATPSTAAAAVPNAAPIARRRAPDLTTAESVSRTGAESDPSAPRPVATGRAVDLGRRQSGTVPIAAGPIMTPRPTVDAGAFPPTESTPTPPPTAPSTAQPPRATDEPEERTPAPTPTATPLMLARCELRREAMDDGELFTRCDRFPQRSQFDLYAFQVENRSRWAFSLCNRTSLDTIIAVYGAGAFDPAAPCQGIIGYNDDYCNVQSRLTVVLDPGTYWLLIAEKYGDFNGPYAFKTEAEEIALGSQCPERVAVTTATPIATETPTPSATTGAIETPTAVESATVPAP